MRTHVSGEASAPTTLSRRNVGLGPQASALWSPQSEWGRPATDARVDGEAISWRAAAEHSWGGVRQATAKVVLDRLDGERAEDVAPLGHGNHRESIPAPLCVEGYQEAAVAVLDDGDDSGLLTCGLFELSWKWSNFTVDCPFGLPFLDCIRFAGRLIECNQRIDSLWNAIERLRWNLLQAGFHSFVALQ